MFPQSVVFSKYSKIYIISKSRGKSSFYKRKEIYNLKQVLKEKKSCNLLKDDARQECRELFNGRTVRSEPSVYKNSRQINTWKASREGCIVVSKPNYTNDLISNVALTLESRV